MRTKTDSMKTLFIAFILVFSFSFFAQNRQEENLYSQMIQINAQWAYHKKECPNEKRFFASDLDAIQTHLFLVCESLLKNTPDNLKQNQLTERLRLIDVLYEYAEKKVFPTNLYHDTRTPYFVDDFGVHCAVGHLLAHSGYQDMVRKIQTHENYAYIEEITTSGLAEWAYEHGFEIDELKWIQPAYWISGQVHPIGLGANKKVTKVFRSSNQGVVFIGDFDSLNGLPCSQIGSFQNNQLSCIGSGLNGLLNNVSNGNGGLTAYGQFEHDNQNYSFASFNQGNWIFENVPNREEYIAQSGFFGGGQTPLEIVLYHPNNPDIKEIWIKVGASTWRKSAQISGNINVIKASSLGRVYAGKFKEFIVFDANGEVEDTIHVNNVIFRSNNNPLSWSGFQSDHMPDEILDFEVINTQIYFAGSILDIEFSTGILLSRFLNNTVQPLMYGGFMMLEDSQHPSINAILYENTTASLLLGGNFNNYGAGMGTMGKNLARYQIAPGVLNYVASLEMPVSGIGLTGNNGSILIGGEFVNHYGQTLNHMGVLGGFVGFNDHNKDLEISLFPNPTQDQIHIIGFDEGSWFCIIDAQGKTKLEGKLGENSSIDLSLLPSGNYFLQLSNNSSKITRKIVKN